MAARFYKNLWPSDFNVTIPLHACFKTVLMMICSLNQTFRQVSYSFHINEISCYAEVLFLFILMLHAKWDVTKIFKNYNFSQNVWRTASDLPVTCHTGIEGEGRYSCNSFSILTLEGGGVNSMPCPILTILEVEVYCLCHVVSVSVFVSKIFSLMLVEHLSISTLWSSVFGSILKCKILLFQKNMCLFLADQITRWCIILGW
jgi:hypothetical protein